MNSGPTTSTRKTLATRLLLSSALIMTAAIGCGPSAQKTESQVNWGVFKNLDQVRSAGLLRLAPNSRVCVTGYKATDVIAAIKVWTDIIGRTPYLKVENCDDKTAARIIRLTGPKAATCRQGEAGFTNTIDNITVCSEYPPDALQHVLLHETGHMWGLCDQYNGGLGCQGGPTNPNTIMGAVNMGKPHVKPTQDDIEGIKVVTSASEIPTNKLWQDLLKNPTSQIQQPGLQNQPPATQRQPSAPQQKPQNQQNPQTPNAQAHIPSNQQGPASQQRAPNSQPGQPAVGQAPKDCITFRFFDICG